MTVSIIRSIRSLATSLRADLMFWLAVSIAVALLAIPQLRTVIWQLGQAATSGRITLFAYLLILGAWGMASIVYVVPPAWTGSPQGSMPRRRVVWISAGLVSTIFLLVIQIANPSGVDWRGWALLFGGVFLTPFVGAAMRRTLDAILDLWLKPSSSVRATIGLAAVGISIVAILFNWFPGHRGPHYTLIGSSFQLAAVGILLFGTWLLGSAVTGGNSPGGIWRSAGRIVVWICASWAFGEAVWYVTSLAPPNDFVTYRFYTAWCALEIVTIVVLYGALADRVQEAIPKAPVRLLAPLAVLLIALATKVPFAEPMQEASATRSQTAPSEANWLSALEKRLASIPAGKPVVVVAASGGGSRAAIYASLVFDAMNRERFPNAQSTKTWSDHILLVSGVSGGSLGSAIYISNLASPRDQLNGILRNSNRDDLSKRIADYASAMADEEPADQEAGKIWAQIQKSASEMAPWSKDAHSPLAEALRSAAVDDACTDFMAPILRGALATNISRGESLWRFWTESFAWGTSNSWEGYSTSDEPRPSFKPEKTPLALFNTTDVSSGRRIAIGFPSLPVRFFEPAKPPKGSSKAPTEPHAETWEDLSLDRPISLAQAVGLSANFPFGFNVVAVHAKQGKTRHLVDGGVVDNTGIDSIRETFDGIRRRAGDSSNEFNQRYFKVWSELRTRGVVLVEIDSGAKPSEPGPATALLSVALEPVDALNNVSYATANETKAAHLKAIADSLKIPVDLKGSLDSLLKSDAPKDADARALAHEIADRGVLRLLHVPFVCNHPGEDNVMTAWSLSPNDKSMVIARFLFELSAGAATTRSGLELFSDPIPKQVAAVQQRAKDLAAQSSLLSAARLSQQRAASAVAMVDGTSAEGPGAAKRFQELKASLDDTKRLVGMVASSEKQFKTLDDISKTVDAVAKSWEPGKGLKLEDSRALKSAFGDDGGVTRELNEIVASVTKSIKPLPETPAQRAERTRREIMQQAPPKNIGVKPQSNKPQKKGS